MIAATVGPPLAIPAETGAARVLVFIIAYDAANEICSVLERIDKKLFNSRHIHFLVLDDASSDATASIASKWGRAQGVGNLTVLRNPVNQGYGGNQKLGYRFALDSGFDLVILLHGDGQYAPELLPRFMDVWQKTQADVILGSRMANPQGAHAGGMPFYKLVGNRVLTGVQNLLTGQNLSEYHTGYRAYSTAFLRGIPFEIDTNDFHFDTEILLQAFHVGAKIEEFPIPTHYGNEVCHVNGMRYAKDVLLATLQFALHQYGMLCSLKYQEIKPDGDDRRDGVLYPAQIMALDLIGQTRASRILDMGGGLGMPENACNERGFEVKNIAPGEVQAVPASAWEQARDFRPSLSLDPFSFNMVLLLDVIARLERPEQMLLDLRNSSTSLVSRQTSPVLVVSVPNIAFISLRIGLLFGRFNYAERGILHISQRRLFTRSALERMLRDCGYIIQDIRPLPVPFRKVIGGPTGRALESLSKMLASLWPGMFAFQFFAICRPLPGVRQVLAQSEVVASSQADASEKSFEAPLQPRTFCG